jgi:hypothetical protein
MGGVTGVLAMRRTAVLAGATCLLVTAGAAMADDAPGELSLGGSNRLEYGVARGSGDESFDDIFRVDARWRRWTLSARFHAVQPSNGEADESIDQRSLEFVDDDLEILGGHFYETWGRGLLLRAYETRSATVGRLERSLALDRDIDGLRLRARRGRLATTLLSGRPLVTPLSGEPSTGSPPERRDTIRGARAVVNAASGLDIAGSYLRVNTPKPEGGRLDDEFLSGEVDAARGPLNLHFSAAHREADEELLPEDGRAWYAALSASTGSIGATYEFKDYERFLGAYNEPPTLVKTQAWTLLNRGTHLSNADDEVGHQASLDWSLDGETGLSLNHARADNHARDDVFEYRQWTLEGRWRAGSGPRLKAVLDLTDDALRGETDRVTGGGELEWFLTGETSATLVVEHQVTEFLVAETQRTTLVTLEYQRAPWLTVALQAEQAAEPVDGRDTWAGATVNLSFGGRHNLNVFAGRRPAGFLCTGGYCFFAPAFDGVEVRLISLFGG